MLHPTVSVIVPVYHAKSYIERCLATLEAQTLRDFDAFFIDDCGGDGSVDIVEQHALHDTRIHTLYNGRNQGSGYSRNRGIAAARGEYLAFLDPDDYLSPDFLELLYNKARANNADIAKGTRSLVRFEEGHRVLEDQDGLNELIQSGLEEGHALYTLFTHQHTTALYRRTLVEKSGAHYGSSRNGEDTTFLLMICHAAQSIAFAPGARYYYEQHEESRTHAFNASRIDGEIVSLTEKIDYILGHNLHGEDCLRYLATRVNNILSLHSFLQYGTSLGNEAPAFLEQIRTQVLRYPYMEEFCAYAPWAKALVLYGVDFSPSGHVAGVEYDRKT